MPLERTPGRQPVSVSGQ